MGFEPRSIWVVMFSNTTIASSTTIPIAIESADSDMMFSVEPVAYRYMNAQTSDMGIVRQMMNVARQRPRNIITTSMTNMNAYMIVSPSEAMAS